MVAIAPSAYYTISADSLHKVSPKPSHVEKRFASRTVSSDEQTASERREAIITAKKANLTKKNNNVMDICAEQKSINHQNELRKLDALRNKSEIVYENRRTQQEQKQSTLSSHNTKVGVIASREALKRAELSQQQKTEDSLKTFIEDVKTIDGDDSDAKAWDVAVDELKVKSNKPSSTFNKSHFIGGQTAVEARVEKLSRRSVQISYQIEARSQLVESRKLEIAAKHFAKLAKDNKVSSSKVSAPRGDNKAIMAANEAAFIVASSAALDRKLYLAEVRRAAALDKVAHPKPAKEVRQKSYSFVVKAKHVKSPKPSHLEKRFVSSKDLSSKMIAAEELRGIKLNELKNKAAKENKKVQHVIAKLNQSESLRILEIANSISNKSIIATSNHESFVNSIAFKSGMNVADAKRIGSYSKMNKRIQRSEAQQKKFIEKVSKAIESSSDFDKTSFVVDVDALKVKAGKPSHLAKRIAARCA